MNRNTIQISVWLLILLIVATACRPGRILRRQGAPPKATQPAAAEPTTAPASVEPTSVPVESTPTNTPVIQTTDTPEPAPTNTPEPAPTDVPTLEPAPADTPVPEPTATSEPPPTEAPVETQEEESSGTTINWDDAAGKPGVTPGQDVGYFVWTDNNRVHIRVVTKGGTRIFSGRVVGNGAILKVDRVAQEKIDFTLREDINQMDFSWVAAGGPDGLDFTFTGTVLRLHLRIDNQPAPAFVFVGAGRLTLDNGLPLRLVR